jgi:hypothetical protein
VKDLKALCAQLLDIGGVDDDVLAATLSRVRESVAATSKSRAQETALAADDELSPPLGRIPDPNVLMKF